MDENGSGQFRPTSMSFATFWGFINDLGTRALPPQIDRSVMHSKSGTDQNNLVSALAGFGLIDEDQRVLPALQALAEADEGGRKAQLAEMVRDRYAPAMVVSDMHGTQQQLNEAFRDQLGLDGSADTRRKAITFFLHAARTADVSLSANFPTTRSGSGAPGVPRKRTARRKPAGDTATNSGTATERTATSGDTYTVDLSSGGSVSVVVNVNLFGLTTDDRNFVIDLVDKLKGYDAVGAQETTEEAVS